eukprot:8799125-Pyramimonas_sp.AAC.1
MTTTTTITLRLFALICSRVTQYAYPEPVTFDRTFFLGYIHSLPRVVGETIENEGQQITGESEDEGIGGRKGRGKKEGGR